jgi:transposase
MDKGTSFVGLDVSKGSIQVAVLYAGREGFVQWEAVHEASAIRRMVRKTQREAAGPVVFCYEAGPCGYVLQRRIKAFGSDCIVVAPSLIPVKPGERIKTDRRDARKLAELLRAGLLTEVHPPTVQEEAVRDLVRCREDAVEDVARCRHRLSKMLLRRGYLWQTGRQWTIAHRRWMRTLLWDHQADRVVFEDYLLALEQTESRLLNLEKEVEAAAQTEPYRFGVGVLGCYRGIGTVTAMTILTELHGIERFTSPRQLMAYLGLVPSEYSSADKVFRGSITKAGNAHLRRVLAEAAHQYRHRPAVGPLLRRRREGQPSFAIVQADKAQQRLHRRFLRMLLKGKPYGTIIIAIARELVGFLWATLQEAHASQKKAA